MKGVLAVARRELVERRNVWAAAAVASLIPVVAPLLPGLRGEPAGDVRAVTALFLAGSFYAGLAIVLGASIVCRELADRRLGFYFSRPVSAFAIWAGKFLGASLLTFGSALLILLPVTLLYGSSLPRPEVPPPLLLLPAAALMFAAIHAIHAASLALRSRSPLVLLDLALAGAAGSIAAAAAGRLAREHATEALGRGLSAFAVIVFAAFLAAGFASVRYGRTDIRAAHRALSATLWGILLTATALFTVYSQWVLAPSPKDLIALEQVAAAPVGSWVTVSGRARLRGDYRPSFLLNTTTGRFRKVHGVSSSLAFSRDGRQAVWLNTFPDRPPFELLTLDLENPALAPLRTKLAFASRWISLSLSPDGKRVAALAPSGWPWFQRPRPGAAQTLLSVYELASGRLLGSAAVGGGGKLFFPDPARVRIYSNVMQWPREEEMQIRIAEFDLDAKKLETTGRVDSLSGSVLLRVEPSGRRMLVHELREKQIRLHDGRTGSPLAVLSSGEGYSSRRAEFLFDGRIAVAEAGPAGARLRILASDGSEEKNVPLGRGGWIALGGEPVSGRVIVAVRPAPRTSAFDWKVFLVDVATGEARQVAEGLLPVSDYGRWIASDPSTPPPGSEAARLFFGPDNSLVHLDPFTGERRVVLAGKVGS